MSISSFNAMELTRIGAYTLSLEKTPLEKFRTSAEVRERFTRLLDEEMESDMEWLVEEIHSCHFNLAEVKHLKLNPEEYEPQYAEFIVLGKAALARLAACFPPIKDIVLSGEFDEEFGCVKSFHSAGEAVMKAFQADLTPRACCVFPVETQASPHPSPLK